MRNLIKGLRAPVGTKLSRRRQRRLKLAKDAAPGRYVVTYTEPRDPSAEEQGNLKKGFRSAKVLDEMPGTVLVEGTLSEVSRAVGSVEHWSYAEEGHFSS